MKVCTRTLLSILLLLGFAIPWTASPSDAAQLEESSQRESPGEPGNRQSTPPFVESDVVLVIDHSTLALLASGIDVDSDGVVGRNRHSAREGGDRIGVSSRFWTTDSGDTIEALQLPLARALVVRLAARNNRVGLVSFTVRARTGGTTVTRYTDEPAVVVPVGKPGAVLTALESLPPARERRRTDLRRLLERGVELLNDSTSGTEVTRPRAILLLSLGRPSAPHGGYWSSKAAVEYANEIAQQGIELWVIPLGSADPRFLSELTQAGGGQVIPLDKLDVQFGAPALSETEPSEKEPSEVEHL